MTLGARIQNRLDAAVTRAAKRYFASKFYFVPTNGLRKEIDAVKRVVGLEEGATLSGSLTARAVEFVLSRAAFDGCLRAAGFGGAGASVHELLRGAKIEEEDETGIRVYTVDASRPYDENSPESGTFRIYCFLSSSRSDLN